MLQASTDAPTDPSAAGTAEPAAVPVPTRLLAQRGLFFGPSGLVPEDLYSVVELGAARRERDRVHLAPATRVSTNTYFGRVHATYWQRWTAVTEMQVSLTVSGTGRVRVLASDTNKVWRIVAVHDVDGAREEVVTLAASVDRFLDGGGLYLQLSTETGEMTVSDVEWTVPAPERMPRTDVTICTFNRVEDCLNTLTALADDPRALATVGVVQVVDQGTDPLESRERFAAVSAALGAQLRYVRQPNLGGAGGFTRGLFDATAGAPEEHSDVLLMDDDVLLEPEILVRLTAFAASTTHPTIVGGQMLNLLHPTHLHISAEYADPEILTVGLPVQGALREANLLGLDDRDLPINQERRVDTEYNGWWSCLIPAAIVREIGYPLPLFFQWDDIEFGYRARAHGFPTVALPGAGVWHADFGWKDWDEWHRYFNLRNGLITAALHTPFTTKRIVRRLGQILAQNLVAMHYGLAVTLLTAVEDFLDGPDILADGSAAAAAEIRRIRSAYPETVVHPITDLPRDAPDFRDVQVVRSPGEPTRHRLTWLKRVAYLAANRAPHRTGFVPAGDAHWWHVSLFERAIVADMGEHGYRIRTRDRAKVLELTKRGARLLRRVAAEGPAVAQRYRDAEPQLTSRENWARLYDVEK
ncbi:glycosyltransferase [Pseudonocardia hydrocarbonoxydans]|uniref:Glycosyl transferase n=1 Tax=Pseudonocardia hydrocarbonoxydans TaxID=76726 RepID=A0A4Y3WT69_9PSEU|nr:glycosyltransferase [Pseudonocardia hydrocarbonoxydans]GEC22072.1 glycosyl transferase [Pseudonocardia hydrocarbonoxydans]